MSEQANVRGGNPQKFRRKVHKTVRSATISRIFLTKLVVGLQIPLEEADRLFSLQSYALDPQNVLLDAIVVNCLQEYEDMIEFYDICEQLGLTLR